MWKTGFVLFPFLYLFANCETTNSECNLTISASLPEVVVPSYVTLNSSSTERSVEYDQVDKMFELSSRVNYFIKRNIEEIQSQKASKQQLLRSGSTNSTSSTEDQQLLLNGTMLSSCITCRNNIHEEIREANLQFIKTYVLKLLGFDEAQPPTPFRKGQNVPLNILEDFYAHQRKTVETSKVDPMTWYNKEHINHVNQQMYAHSPQAGSTSTSAGSSSSSDKKQLMDGYLSDSPDTIFEQSLTRSVTKTTHRIYIFNSGTQKTKNYVYFDIPPKTKDLPKNTTDNVLADHNIDRAFLHVEVCVELANLSFSKESLSRRRPSLDRNLNIKVISIQARNPPFNNPNPHEKVYKEESTIDIDLELLESGFKSKWMKSVNNVPANERSDGLICGEYVKMDVTPLVKTWSYRPEMNLGALIKTLPKYDNKFIVKDQESFLEILTSQSSQRRRKRFTNMKCTEEDNETRCCRYPLMVDFEKFGWNWIIAPKKYEANYCSGECAINFLPGYTHTHVMQLATLAPACCSPRKMLPLSLLYYNRQEIVVHTTLQNMIVDMCSCS